MKKAVLQISILTVLFTLFVTYTFAENGPPKVAESDRNASKKAFRLHPENPRYFEFRGKPTVLVTSGEHYGALLNAAFDIEAYLKTLAQDGLNNTRTFSGCYAETPGSFTIVNNTLAPEANQLISPWKRSDQPGYSGGGNKFDLNQWNDEYFKRLHRFMTTASELGIIVEMNLFCPMYNEWIWKRSPMNAENNVNGIGRVDGKHVYTLQDDKKLLQKQEDLTRKIVTELSHYDNVYFEICNEPYFGNVTLEWHRHITDIVQDTESDLQKKDPKALRHLVSWNVANQSQKVQNPHPGISIFNFHYCTPPNTVEINRALNLPIGMNETGFKGVKDDYYRREGWNFMLAGGALFNNLDYSFTVKNPTGKGAVAEPNPGGGGVTFRKQMKFLRAFFDDFNFIKTTPDRNIVPGDGEYALVHPGKIYAIYFADVHKNKISINLPNGLFNGYWLNPITGEKTSVSVTGAGKNVALSVPKSIRSDAALLLKVTE